MPHEVETMFYYQEVPWHGLGTKVEHALTAQEAIVEAGLDWDVELRNVLVPDASGTLRVVTGKKAVVRMTDDRIFGILGDSYRPVQNSQSFKFFDEVVSSGMVNYESAGSLQSGAKVWILAKMQSPLEVAKEQVDRYIVLVNSHDGSSALQMYWTPVRVVCMNTLRMSQAHKLSPTFYTRHTLNVMSKIDTAKVVLGLADSYYAEWLEQANILAKKKLTDDQALQIVTHAFGQDGNEEIYPPIRKEMEKVLALRFEGVGQDNSLVQGTAWQVYNAVVEYSDYYKVPRSKDESARLASVWFGSGKMMKELAWDAALKV